MEAQRIIINTASGGSYLLDKDGYVLEFSNGLSKDPKGEDRKTWQITGFWYNIGFGHTRTIPLAEWESLGELRLKNGRPKYGLTDIDHGTQRWQGNKDYHGVSSVYIP